MRGGRPRSHPPRLEFRYLDEEADDLPDAVERCLRAKRERRALSVGLLRATPPRSFPNCSAHGFEADIVTDQTSAHDPLVGYVPAGLTLAEADCTAPGRSRRVRPPRAPLGRRPLLRDGRLHGRRRGGVRLREQPARRGEAGRLRARVRLPGLRPRLHPAAVLRGQGPVPLGGAVGRPGRHRRHRPRRARGVPAKTSASPAGSMAGERIAFQGLPARICWLGYGERRRLGLRFNDMVRERRTGRRRS